LPYDRDPKIYYGMGLAYFSSNQRVSAMDMITKLHEMGEEDLASRLENSMRENARVNTSSEAAAGPSSTPAGLGPLPKTPDQPTGTMVRLRGRLSDY
ncbi:MAG: hypothetical protein KGJ11_09835, partial [Candidatus Omnitrophica bacterium]|nr:hypothetical protein [Candidatus Omnitrophota bacterium]